MESTLHLKLNFISLESLALTASAIQLWELPDVQEKVRNHFNATLKYQWTDSSRKVEWDNLKNAVFKKIELFKSRLPSKILIQLYDVARVIQQKIHAWYRYVMVVLGLESRFASKIYWTSKGTINESRIFNEFWLNEPNFSSVGKNSYGFETNIFNVAFLLAEEDFLKKNAEEMIKKIGHPNQIGKVHNVYEIVKTWLQENNKQASVYIVLGEEEVNVLIDCRFNRLFKFLYRENLISPRTVKDILFKLPNFLTQLYFYSVEENVVYEKERIIDILIYAFNQASIQDKIAIFSHNPRLFVLLLAEVWPYHTLLLQVLNFFADTAIIDLEKILPLVLKAMFDVKRKREQESIVLDIYRKTDDCMIMKIIEMMPRDLKRETLLNNPDCLNVVDLYKFYDYKILRFILDDNDFRDLRDVVIDRGDGHFRDFLTKFMIKEIDECMVKLGLTDSEKKRLKMKYNVLLDTRLICSFARWGPIENLDKLVNWLSDSKTEPIKSKINAIEIILQVMNNNLQRRDLPNRNFVQNLDAFLIWLYEDEKKILNFKLHLDLFEHSRVLIKKVCAFGKFNAAFIRDFLVWQFGPNDKRKVKEFKSKILTEDEFILEQILLLWHLNYFKSGAESAEKECMNFLSWFCESEEIVFTNLKNFVEKEYFIGDFCDLFGNENEEIIDKFLKFCNLTNDKTNEIKEKIRSFHY